MRLINLLEQRESPTIKRGSFYGLRSFIDGLYDFLFLSEEKNHQTLQADYVVFQRKLSELLDNSRKAELFFEEIPTIYKKLLLDAEAIYEADPAARQKTDIYLFYPGFCAITIYRFAHHLWQLKAFEAARIISAYAHSKTGIDIHPAAQIGKRFFIDHGTGIVIGETSIIGNDVKLYQGVTLGALHISKEAANKKRHPTIEDGVIIYSSATILGGETIVGQNCIIGGNVWLTRSIPPNSVVYHKSEIGLKGNRNFPEPIHFSI